MNLHDNMRLVHVVHHQTSVEPDDGAAEPKHVALK
jgi:hypothetical protein